MFNSGDTVKGKYTYQIKKHLNTGEYAEAYHAHHEGDVFLKKYTDPSTLFTPWAKQYIRYQQDIMNRLNAMPLNDFVVNILDEFVYDDFYIQVHEWSPYSDLDKYLNDRKDLFINKMGDLLIAQVFMHTMDLLHKEEVIHTDLKPENIMLIKSPNGLFIPRICDFDWSVAVGKDHPWEGGIRGTPYYMSYEHITGDKVLPASDIYTCGIILYQLLAGKHPIVASLPPGKSPEDFTAGELNTYLKSILHNHSKIPKPSQLCAEKWRYNSKIDDIVHRCLHPDPTQRPDAKKIHAVLINKTEATKLYLNHKNGFSLIASRHDVELKQSYIGQERCRLFDNYKKIPPLQAWLMPSKTYSKWFLVPPGKSAVNTLTVQWPSQTEKKLDDAPIELKPGSYVRIRDEKDYSHILCEWNVEYQPE